MKNLRSLWKKSKTRFDGLEKEIIDCYIAFLREVVKYKDEIIKELQDIPDEEMPKLLEIIHYLKEGHEGKQKNLEG